MADPSSLGAWENLQGNAANASSPLRCSSRKNLYYGFQDFTDGEIFIGAILKSVAVRFGCGLPC
jgi:hypothetical protein